MDREAGARLPLRHRRTRRLDPHRPRKDVPLDRLRDRTLFETAYVCGARAAEICGLYVEDFDLRLDDEHVEIHGKGGTVRTILLDDRGYVALARLYLARSGYTSGPMFRASINGSGGPLSYDAAHHRWNTYCTAAGLDIDIHQLRPAHAAELINSGVSIEVIRRRLGHASTETTQIYTLLADKVADDEIRAAAADARRAARSRRPQCRSAVKATPAARAPRRDRFRRYQATGQGNCRQRDARGPPAQTTRPACAWRYYGP